MKNLAANCTTLAPVLSPVAGVNLHNNPWIPTDTVVPDPDPCGPRGCGNYRATPKAQGMKAFSPGSRGFVEPVKISNPKNINLATSNVEPL